MQSELSIHYLLNEYAAARLVPADLVQDILERVAAGPAIIWNAPKAPTLIEPFKTIWAPNQIIVTVSSFSRNLDIVDAVIEILPTLKCILTA